MATLLVTKQAAAQRQIDSAIRMLFVGEDPLAIHTLTAAAHAVLSDLDHKAEKKSDQRYKRVLESVQKQSPEMLAFSRWHLAVYPSIESDRITTAAGDINKLSRDDQLDFGDFLLKNVFKT